VGRAALPDWDRLGFGFVETDELYRCLGEAGRNPPWDAGEFLPFGPVSLSPAACFFSYGLGVFEGLKARRDPAGRVLLFRHRENAKRFRRSAERLMMAPFPEDEFVRAVEGVVRRNQRFVPPHGKGTFYLRPLQHAIDPKLGIKAGTRYWVLVFGCPVASYFGSRKAQAEAGGVRLKVVEQGRVAPGGTGSAKAMGNYAGGIQIAAGWQREGFDDVLYLDARHVEYVTETSGSNVFVKLTDGTLVTPPLDDQILPGITRDSVIRIARDVLGVDVQERPISIREAVEAGAEMFCAGTAWTVQAVGEVDYRGRVHRFDARELQQALLEELAGIQSGEREDRFGWVTEVDLGG
jgi:branched-chain amino acid aminotransferase